MKIKTRLYISAGISIFLVLLLALVVFTTSNEIAEKNKEYGLAHNMHLVISELDIITYEYLMHREERMEQQWKLKYNSAAKILRKGKEEKTELIRADYIDLGNLFLQVTGNYKKVQNLIQIGASQKKIDAAFALEKRLVTQFLIASQSIITDASRLAEKSHIEATEVQKLANALVLILMVVLTIIMITITLLVTKSIAKPITKLMKGVEIIGKGDLEHKVGIQTKDELGQLATAFNQMTENLSQDITKRKKAEEELIKIKILLSETEKIGKIGGWEVDLETMTQTWTEETYRIHEVDSDFEPDVAKGISFYAPSSRPIIERAFNHTVETGEPFDLELEFVTAKGNKIWVHSVGKAQMEEGVTKVVSGSFQDITDRKQAEKELQKYQQHLEELVEERTIDLETANKELEAFSYSVSHDLRAPLTRMDGFSKALQTNYANKLDKKGVHYLDRIRASSQLMARLIDDLLILSRISQRELKKKVISLSATVEEIVGTLQDTDKDRKAEVTIQPNVKVTGDAGFLKAMMENLLNNAWKFTHEEKLAKIDFGTIKKEGKNWVFLKDNGIGFNMKYYDKLFTPFQRLHSGDYKGSGIGLSTVQRIINKHGGQIHAESEPGKGTTFYFII